MGETTITTEEILCRWAANRYGIELPARVEIQHYEGWAGTDVTPGEAPYVSMTAYDADGKVVKYDDDLLVTTDLIREIVAASRAA